MDDLTTTNGSGIAAIIFLVLYAAVLLFIFIFWVKMLINAIRRDFGGNSSEKLIWVLVILILGPLGAIIYYFMIKRKQA